MTPTLLVSVGTDHHAFDRLGSWIGRWLDRQHETVSCVYQAGSSTSPAGVTTLGVVSRQDLLHHMRAATVVVTHGGPGLIKDAHEAGHVPIVVPRRAALGEAVDDHQVAFSREMASMGWVHLAETEEQLVDCLDAALADPASVRWHEPTRRNGDPVRRFASMVDQAMRQPQQRIRWQRVPHTLRSVRAVLRGEPLDNAAAVGTDAARDQH